MCLSPIKRICVQRPINKPLCSFCSKPNPLKPIFNGWSRRANCRGIIKCAFSPERMAIYPQTHTASLPSLCVLHCLWRQHENFRRMENKGQGYFSLGWLLKPELIFLRQKCAIGFQAWISSVLKRCFIPMKACACLICAKVCSSESVLEELSESRLELIDSKPFWRKSWRILCWGCWSRKPRLSDSTWRPVAAATA